MKKLFDFRFNPETQQVEEVEGSESLDQPKIEDVIAIHKAAILTQTIDLLQQSEYAQSNPLFQREVVKWISYEASQIEKQLNPTQLAN